MREKAVTAYFSSKQLLLLTFSTLQRQTAVTVYFSSKQLLLFVFARRSVCQYSMAEENPAALRQTAVTAYFLSKQLLLFVFAVYEICCDASPLLSAMPVTALFCDGQHQGHVLNTRVTCSTLTGSTLKRSLGGVRGYPLSMRSDPDEALIPLH